MTYPAHTQPDFMVVHPPTHYVLIAQVMRTGLSLFHAAGVPIFVLVLLAFALIVTGRFPFAVKIGLMFGLYLGIFVWGAFRPVRPDLHLSAAWFAGLISLESGRLEGWKTWRLAIGAFLLTYASSLHYPGSFAFVGVVVYVSWCIWDLGWVAGGRGALAMVLAGAASGVPYLTWFVLPYRNEIRDVISGVAGTFVSPWKLHFETYTTWWHHPETWGAFYRWRNRPITAFLTAPLFAIPLPAAFLAPLLLLLRPSTRGIGFAALPYLGSLVFFVGGQGKNATNTGYYAGEIILYLACLAMTLPVVLALARRSNGNTTAWNAYVPVALLSLAVLIDIPNSMPARSALTLSFDYESVARAAGRQMLGSGAVLGTASPMMWYHGGAQAIYFITPDLLYPDDISRVDLHEYFARFDAFSLEPHTSGVTWNRQRMSLESWYVNGILRLRGFMIDTGHLLSYLLVSGDAKGPVQGYCYDVPSEKLWRFLEAQNGDSVFVSFIAPGDKANDDGFKPQRWGHDMYYLPGAQRATLGGDALFVQLLPLNEFRRIQPVLSHFRIVQEVRGNITTVDIGAVTSKIDEGPPIRFPRTIPELDASRVQTVLKPTKPAFMSESAAVIIESGSISVDAPSLQSDIVAISEPIAVERQKPYRVSYDLQIEKGALAFNVMNADRTQYRHQLIRRYPQRWGREEYVITPRDSSLVLTVGAYNTTSQRTKVRLRNISIDRVELRSN